VAAGVEGPIILRRIRGRSKPASAEIRKNGKDIKEAKFSRIGHFRRHGPSSELWKGGLKGEGWGARGGTDRRAGGPVHEC